MLNEWFTKFTRPICWDLILRFNTSSKAANDYNSNWHLATVAMDDVTRS